MTMSIRSWVVWPGAPFALGSAALFGASTPMAKALLGEGVNPWLLAGLLYLGSGVGLAFVMVVRRFVGPHADRKAADWPSNWRLYQTNIRRLHSSSTLARHKGVLLQRDRVREPHCDTLPWCRIHLLEDPSRRSGDRRLHLNRYFSL